MTSLSDWKSRRRAWEVEAKERLQLCETVIPGVGQCELVMHEHTEDAQGRLVHRVGPVTWNGEQ